MILPYLAIAVLLFATVYSAVVGLRQKPGPEASSWFFPAGARRSTRIVVGIASLIFVVAIGAWVALSVHQTARRSLRFLIPEGYTGWVRVEFEVQGAPMLPVEGSQYVLRIAADGTLKTSSLEQYGWAKDSYYFDSIAGARPIPDAGPDRRVWGKVNGEAAGTSGKRKYEEFFVGNEQEFKQQGAGINSGP
jgi:hypothetical protein